MKDDERLYYKKIIILCRLDVSKINNGASIMYKTMLSYASSCTFIHVWKVDKTCIYTHVVHTRNKLVTFIILLLDQKISLHLITLNIDVS